MMKVNRNDLDIQVEGEVEIFLLNGEIYNGSVFEIHNNNLVAEAEVRRGKKNGRQVLYYPDRCIERESYYVDGVLDGIIKNYDTNGFLQEESFFEKGICLWYKLFGAKGALVKEYNIDKTSFEYILLERLRERK